MKTHFLKRAPVSGECCGSCNAFYEKSQDEFGRLVGECRLGPPMPYFYVVKDEYVEGSHWPMVTGTTWCKQYESVEEM